MIERAFHGSFRLAEVFSRMTQHFVRLRPLQDLLRQVSHVVDVCLKFQFNVGRILIWQINLIIAATIANCVSLFTCYRTYDPGSRL